MVQEVDASIGTLTARVDTITEGLPTDLSNLKTEISNKAADVCAFEAVALGAWRDGVDGMEKGKAVTCRKHSPESNSIASLPVFSCCNTC